MIVKVVKAGRAGSERALGTYVLDLKHERKGERLGEYALDLKHGGEKVEWARTVHTGVDDPRWAIQAIEQHNAQNPRAHRVSRNEHVIVSFTEGERPTREQMARIEDRLMDAIGFGDHPRVSAVHKPQHEKGVDNWHLHIAVSRIDPTTLKAEHPRHNHFSLQAEAARLEIELGLSQEPKSLLRREREEIEYRREVQQENVVAEWQRAERTRPAEPERDQEPDGWYKLIADITKEVRDVEKTLPVRREATQTVRQPGRAQELRLGSTPAAPLSAQEREKLQAAVTLSRGTHADIADERSIAFGKAREKVVEFTKERNQVKYGFQQAYREYGAVQGQLTEHRKQLDKRHWWEREARRLQKTMISQLEHMAHNKARLVNEQGARFEKADRNLGRWERRMGDAYRQIRGIVDRVYDERQRDGHQAARRLEQDRDAERQMHRQRDRGYEMEM